LAVKTLVPEGEDGEETTLSALRGDKAMVIDFWTTKCTRCPAALTKLNGEAGLAENDDVVFLSCALSQGDGNYEVAADLVCDGSFDALTHVFMDVAVKETAKAAFGFTSVPFYVVVGKVRGRVDVGTASVTLLCSAVLCSRVAPAPLSIQCAGRPRPGRRRAESCGLPRVD